MVPIPLTILPPNTMATPAATAITPPVTVSTGCPTPHQIRSEPSPATCGDKIILDISFII